MPLHDPEWIEINRQVAALPHEDKCRFYEDHFAFLARVTPNDRLDGLRSECFVGVVREQVGEEGVARVLRVVNGYTELRRTGIIRYGE